MMSEHAICSYYECPVENGKIYCLLYEEARDDEICPMFFPVQKEYQK